MADYIVKIIPRDPFSKISEPTLQKAKEYLKKNVLCDSIGIECGMTPVFVDCGSNLESIVCPKCHSELTFDWWGEVMDKAGESKFTSLVTELPCCGKTVSLNDLEYYYPCGFACCAIDILNPVCDFGDCLIEAIQKILGANVRIIKAHL